MTNCMFCSKCENEVNEGAVFCPKNGEKLINENYQQKKDSTETEAITSFILGLVSVAFWVTIIIPILGIYFGNKGKNSDKATFAKIGKALSIVSLTVGAIVVFVLFGLPKITEVITKNSLQVDAIPTKEEIYDWYTSLGIIETETCDNPPAKVLVDLALAYKKDDKETSAEIEKASITIKAYLRQYFNNKTVEELKTNNEATLVNEIKNGINDKVLLTSRICAVEFLQKDVFIQN